MTKSIILLSGGVDSVVSLASTLEKENVKLALFFNYGQKSFEQEKEAVLKITEYYNLNLEIIELPWLKKITTTSLVNSDMDVPELKSDRLDDLDAASESCSKVWVPNRNGVFVSVSAAYADSFDFDKIIIGANKEEGKTFKDNSLEFINKTNEHLAYSTRVMPKVIAPLIDLDKFEIMELGKKLNVPFQYIRSCYNNTQRHCGKCESCERLKRGLERAGLFDILDMLFECKE